MSRIPLFLLSILSLTLLILPSHSLYTYLHNNQVQCFQEDLNPNSFAHIYYEAPNLQPTDTIAYSVTDSTGKRVDDRILQERKSMLYFTSPADKGEVYEICFTPRLTFQVPLEFRVRIETDDDDREATAKKEKLDRIRDELETLKHKVTTITEDHAYFRRREQRFRKTTASTASRVFWLSLFEVMILVAVGVYQAYHMKTFLKTKKLA